MPVPHTITTAVTDGAGNWVAGGQLEFFLSQNEAVSWTTPAAPSVTPLCSAFGGGTLLLGGASTSVSGQAGWAYSTNGGTSWTSGNTLSNGEALIGAVTWDGAQFVALAGSAAGTVPSLYTSPNGIAWTFVGTLQTTSTEPAGIAHGSGVYVVGTNGGTVRVAATLAALLTAGDTSLGTGGAAVASLAFGNNTFVGVDSAGHAVSSKTAGASWALENPLFGTAAIAGICYVGGATHKFCAVGANGLISTRTGG